MNSSTISSESIEFVTSGWTYTTISKSSGFFRVIFARRIISSIFVMRKRIFQQYIQFAVEDSIEHLLLSTYKQKNSMTEHEQLNSIIINEDDMDIVVESEKAQCSDSNRLVKLEQEISNIEIDSKNTMNNHRQFSYSGAIKKVNRQINNFIDITDGSNWTQPVRSNVKSTRFSHNVPKESIERMLSNYELTTAMESIGLQPTMSPQYRSLPPLPRTETVEKSNQQYIHPPKSQRPLKRPLKPSNLELSSQIPDVGQYGSLDEAYQQKSSVDWTAFEEERKQFWNATETTDLHLTRSPSATSVRSLQIKKLGRKDAKRKATKEFDDCRNLAMQHTQLNAECYSKAKDAMQRGDTSVALYYSQGANLHEMKIDMYNHKAANCMMEVHSLRHNNPDKLDLHFLHVNEAVENLDIFLDERITNLENNQIPYKYIDVITGRGLHSPNGIPIIKHKVENRFRERNLTWSEVNPGCLKVKIFTNSPVTAYL